VVHFFLFTFKDSLINGLILLEFILTKYISTWVLINEVIINVTLSE
jgi:hypothetical protein